MSDEMEMRADEGVGPYRGNDIEALTPEQLGGEIRLLTAQARRMALSYAIQIGYRLKVAHDKVGPHGWAEWLKSETEFSAAAASRFEKLYEGYGDAQGSIFGVKNNFPTLENLSVSNALRLLAVPEEEREQVAEELDAEHLSARELEKALAERDEWKKATADAREEAMAEHRRAEELEYDLDRVSQERVDLLGKLEAAEKRAVEDAEKTRADNIRPYEEKLAEAEKRVKELESRPVEVAVERDEEAIKKAAEGARKAAEDAAKKEMDKLREKLEKAEKAREKAEKDAEDAKKRAVEDAGPYKEKIAAAEAETEALRKKLLSAESGANVVAALFSLGQQNFNSALEKVTAMKATHPEVAEKLLAGMEQVVGRLLETVKEARG